ncbi:SusC/RagA family TonB-linked outer membrane protein [Halalkalibaculum sp. DA3122]|uniref:SusC/RagA family TonB-linked outer membrane protein n=1 Tax=unclassified Halalkalibaculum TaxID=2964617 RepID=UPI0037545A49
MTALHLQVAEKQEHSYDKQWVANESSSENEKSVSLEFSGVKLVTALKMLADEVNVGLALQTSSIPDKTVTVNVNEVSVFEALDLLLEGTSLEAVLPPSRDVLIVRKKLEESFKKAFESVSGTVTEAQTGNPLPGVNVIIKGTTQGTATNSDGQYDLPVESLQDTLVFSFIGYETNEVPINGRTSLDVALTPQALSGEELVVVGYGTQRSKDVTGSVASVPMEDLDSQPITGLDQAITGKVAGVQVNNYSGTPGAGPTIRIRGIGSIGAGNDPLYVVDGFPIPNSASQQSNPLNSIAPNQIESIEVLKDASATAIYGSRGANGVILVTTKSGTPETQIEINSSVGLQSVRERGMVEVLDAREWAQLVNDRTSDLIRWRENREPQPSDIPEMYRNPEQYGEGTDWPSLIHEDALMHNQNITIRGGNEAIRSMVSVNFLDQEGTLLETGYKRYNFRVNVNATLSDKLDVGLRLAPSLEKQELGDTDGYRTGDYASAYLVNPIADVRDENGNLNPMVDGDGMLAFPNPVLQAKQVENTLRRGRAIGNAFVEYELIDGLEFNSTINFDWSDTRTEYYKPTTVGSFNTYPPTEAVGYVNSSNSINWLSENTLNYNADFGRNHSVDAVLGLSVQQETTDFANVTGRGFADDEIRTLGAAPTQSGATNTAEWGLVSTLARVNYDYQDKYLVTATIRRDGSSRFGSDNRWGTFPSFSLGWRLSEEAFLSGADKIDNLMIRAGYGKSGNFNIGNYAHLGVVESTDYALNSQEAAGRSITNMGNPNLGWEEVEQLNVGLDVSLLANRLNVTVDYYNKVTSNMLLNVETPITSGFSNALVNRGEVTNKGIELAIQSTVVSNSLFNWDLNFNIDHNANKVTELDAPIISPVSVAKHITEEGYPIGQFYGYVVEGLYSSNEEIAEHIPNGPAPNTNRLFIPGAYKHKDVNGDGQITPIDDFARIGDPYPDFTWGLTNTLNYKGFDLSISMTGSHGGETMQAGREDFWNLDGVFNVSAEANDRWMSPENPGDGLIPRAMSRVIHRYAQSTWIVDNSHIWIRDVTLGHTFSSANHGFLSTVGANEARLYVNVHNAWISNTNLQNPEVQLLSGNPLRPGETRNSNYPISRVFTLGININF